jgi:hypothetical protein
VTAYAKDGVETKAASGKGPAHGMSISADFNTVVLNGVTIQRAADGHLVISAPGGTVKQAAPANDTPAKAKAALQIGDLDDGGVYVGLSDGKDLHAALADEPEYLTYEEALAAAEQMKAVHPTAHVPTAEELDKNLFDNGNTGHLKGTFNTMGAFPESVYRSSTLVGKYDARVLWFDDGSADDDSRVFRRPVRLVW